MSFHSPRDHSARTHARTHARTRAHSSRGHARRPALTRAFPPSATTQTSGKIAYSHDDGSKETLYLRSGGCTNTTPSDLLPTRNPRCDVSTYVGGLQCCHHKWLLTDREQRPRLSNETLNFRMKVRIWCQQRATAHMSHTWWLRTYMHTYIGVTIRRA